MELLLVVGVAVGLGVLATVLLATRIPESVLVRGQAHGRHAHLVEDEADLEVSRPSRKDPHWPRRLFRCRAHASAITRCRFERARAVVRRYVSNGMTVDSRCGASACPTPPSDETAARR